MEETAQSVVTRNTATLVAIHRQIIVEEVSYAFGKALSAFIGSSKAVKPFDEIADLAAYMLERDTAAPRDLIAKCIGCDESNVALHIKRVANSLARNDATMLDRLLSIGDAVNERIEQKGGVVWHRHLSPEATERRAASELAPEVWKILQPIVRETGIELGILKSNDQRHAIVRARDIAIFLLIKHLRLSLKEAGEILGRDFYLAQGALQRMRHPNRLRRHLLEKVCASLNIDGAKLQEK